MQPVTQSGDESWLWDAIVVGAGPAGCAAAYDLAAAGRSVLLLDRAAFPRPKACAGGLTLKAVRALRYPVDPVVRLWVRSLVLEGAGRAHRLGRRAPVCAMTVREELDSFCLEQTRQRGAIFRRVPSVQALAQEADSVVLHLGGGESLRGRYVVGADGVHSRVRTLAGQAPWFRTGFAVEANVPHPDAPARFPLTFDFAAVPWGYGWLFPRNDHVNVGLYTAAPAATAEALQALNRAALERYIDARCRDGGAPAAPVGQFLGLGAAAYEPPAAARVLLAGDAAGFVDPLTGEGLYGAIRSGQAAAAAIHEALRAGSPAAGAARFLRETALLRGDLGIAEHAARSFYPQPARGFDLLRLPLLPRAALRAYAEGSSLARLLRTVRAARHLAGIRPSADA